MTLIYSLIVMSGSDMCGPDKLFVNTSFHLSELSLEKQQWQKQFYHHLGPGYKHHPLAKYKVAEKPNFSTLYASNPGKDWS